MSLNSGWLCLRFSDLAICSGGIGTGSVNRFPWLLDSTAKLLDLMKSTDFLAVTPFSKCTAITRFSKQGEIGLFCSLKWTSAKL